MPIFGAQKSLRLPVRYVKLTGLLLLRLVAEACWMFMSARVSMNATDYLYRQPTC